MEIFGFTLGWAHILIIFVALQRLIEIAYASSNSQRLLREGGTEHHSGHYIFLSSCTQLGC